MTVGLTFCTVILFQIVSCQENKIFWIYKSQVCIKFIITTTRYDTYDTFTFEVMSNLSISFDNANTEKLTHFELFRILRDKILDNFPLAAAIKFSDISLKLYASYKQHTCSYIFKIRIISLMLMYQDMVMVGYHGSMWSVYHT